MNTSYLIELKKEYNDILTHILTPIILEGLQHLYNESKKVSEKNNVLKTFQTLLKKIPTWDNNLINRELTRIQTKTQNYPWLTKLIQAVFKVNMLISNLEPSEVLKNEVNLGKFIHHIYIECARAFWMDPFLFYHDYSSLEQKKNYLEIMKIINCSIENTIRLLLPMNVILDKFLGITTVNNKALEITELYDIPLLLDIPLVKEQKGGNLIDQIDMQLNNQQGIQLNDQQMMMPVDQPVMMQGGQQIPTNLDKQINEKILNIINKNNILTESNEINHFTVNNHSANNFANNLPNNLPNNLANNNQQIKHHSDKRSSSTLKRIINESLRQSHNNVTKTNSAQSEVKNKILKELDSDTVTYNPEDNVENYQDIFSNSDIKNTINTHEKVEKKSREKFFNNYLNV